MSAKIIIKNTSRYPDAKVQALVKFAADYVESEAQRLGWRDKFLADPIQVNVQNTEHTYSGVYKGIQRNAKTDWVYRRRCIVRVGAPGAFPVNSKYRRYKAEDMPDSTLNSWEECIVGVTAHELSHIHYTYASGDRKGAEQSAEWTELDCVEKFRKERSGYDALVAKIEAKSAEKAALAIADKSPDAQLAKRLESARAKLVKWTRKHKLATTKLKLATRLVARLEKLQLKKDSK